MQSIHACHIIPRLESASPLLLLTIHASLAERRLTPLSNRLEIIRLVGTNWHRECFFHAMLTFPFCKDYAFVDLPKVFLLLAMRKLLLGFLVLHKEECIIFSTRNNSELKLEWFLLSLQWLPIERPRCIVVSLKRIGKMDFVFWIEISHASVFIPEKVTSRSFFGVECLRVFETEMTYFNLLFHIESGISYVRKSSITFETQHF